MRKVMAVVLFSTLALACERGPKSSAGFHLPDGDVAQGQATFVELKCNACHSVAKTALPLPVAEPRVPVELGGRVVRAKTDGELFTAIVDPSHRLAPGYKREDVKSGTLSRMGDYSETMTVKQLVDVVAFLQSRYEVIPPSVPVR